MKKIENCLFLIVAKIRDTNFTSNNFCFSRNHPVTKFRAPKFHWPLKDEIFKKGHIFNEK